MYSVIGNLICNVEWGLYSFGFFSIVFIAIRNCEDGRRLLIDVLYWLVEVIEFYVHRLC